VRSVALGFVPDLPEDPTSVEGLARASFVTTPPGWSARQRDSLSDEDREAWDIRVVMLGGQIVTKELPSEQLGAGRLVAGSQTVSYYLMPEIP
jgi:hypothetical protein